MVTPDDKSDLAEVILSLYVGRAGAIKATLFDSSTVTYPALAVGRHPMRVKRVFATGTTATGLVGEV